MNSKRELRAINRDFSLGEYGQSWTKLERYLFIEIYNVIKDFYMSVSDGNIITFSSESISLNLPVNKLNKNLFKPKHKNRDLMNAVEGLSNKQINLKTLNENGQYGFDFISMFIRLKFDPSVDKNNMYVKIPSEVYEQMVPIKSFCLLDLKMISEFNSGNTVRLYEIFKSYAFRKSITISFDVLRKQLGFFNEGSYKEWKYFNSQVLKKAVNDINSHKEFDIEVVYEKRKGVNEIEFSIITHKVHKQSDIKILDINEIINNRKPSLIQIKYIDTLIGLCNKSLKNKLNNNEIKEWIITDIINSQTKKGNEFDFKRLLNAISDQIRKGLYTKPYSHKHLYTADKAVFNADTYQNIKNLVYDGKNKEALTAFSKEELIANQFEYIIE